MANSSPTIHKLVEFLDIFRQLVVSHPEYELTELSEDGVCYTANALEELRRDLSEKDATPDGFEHSFEHYLVDKQVGSKDYAVVVYMAIDQLAHDLLISSDGQCNWENHRALGNYGYRVRKGESDSFGWLTGVICCNDFHHVYG